jgi:hypothetical protein
MAAPTTSPASSPAGFNSLGLNGHPPRPSPAQPSASHPAPPQPPPIAAEPGPAPRPVSARAHSRLPSRSAHERRRVCQSNAVSSSLSAMPRATSIPCTNSYIEFRLGGSRARGRAVRAVAGARGARGARGRRRQLRTNHVQPESVEAVRSPHPSANSYMASRCRAARLLCRRAAPQFAPPRRPAPSSAATPKAVTASVGMRDHQPIIISGSAGRERVDCGRARGCRRVGSAAHS